MQHTTPSRAPPPWPVSLMRLQEGSIFDPGGEAPLYVPVSYRSIQHGIRNDWGEKTPPPPPFLSLNWEIFLPDYKGPGVKLGVEGRHNFNNNKRCWEVYFKLYDCSVVTDDRLSPSLLNYRLQRQSRRVKNSLETLGLSLNLNSASSQLGDQGQVSDCPSPSLPLL